MDFVEPYLRAIFGFLGITDVTFIKAYGTDEATVLRTSEEALHKIDNCLAPMSVV
jgi:FMN-dependent NADH-azoreductase